MPWMPSLSLGLLQQCKDFQRHKIESKKVPLFQYWMQLFYLINEDLRDREENLNILDQRKTKLEMNKCLKFINSIMLVLSIHVY